MKTAYKLYQVFFKKYSNSEITIEAVSRKGKVYIVHLKRTDERYWEGSSDFQGLTNKKTFKGIVLEFLRDLVNEARDYDQRWYRFNCVVRMEDEGERPLTWEEVCENSLYKEAEPDFKGGVKFLIERYE